MNAAQLRVVVGESREVIRRRVIRILARQFEVISAVADSHELVEASLAVAPDVIVANAALPPLSGIAARRELQASGKHIPFVLISTEENVSASINQADGILVHEHDIPADLSVAVRAAAAGESFLSFRYRRSHFSGPV